MTERDTQLGSAHVAIERLWEMARDPSPVRAEAVNKAQTTRPEIEIVGDLLTVAKMACSDLPPDARSALRTLLLVITMLCKPGSSIDTDIQDLIEAASMACAELPREKGSALRTLLRVASQKLSEAPRRQAGGSSEAEARREWEVRRPKEPRRDEPRGGGARQGSQPQAAQGRADEPASRIRRDGGARLLERARRSLQPQGRSDHAGGLRPSHGAPPGRSEQQRRARGGPRRASSHGPCTRAAAADLGRPRGYGGRNHDAVSLSPRACHLGDSDRVG